MALLQRRLGLRRLPLSAYRLASTLAHILRTGAFFLLRILPLS
jgi:hypothetical protein